MTKNDKLEFTRYNRDAVEKMKYYGIDALVTGEVKHHHFLYAYSNSLCVVEAGHFATEDVVINPLTDSVASAFPEVAFEKSQALCEPVLSVRS